MVFCLIIVLMNIYLDIAGTLGWTQSPINDVVELLEYCLDNYPGQVYWLTTFCKNGINRTYEALSFLPDDLRQRAFEEVKPTDWSALKTDAIDFTKPFVWIDDSIYDSERRVLDEYFVEDSYYWMNSSDPEGAKKALDFIKNRAKA